MWQHECFKLLKGKDKKKGIDTLYENISKPFKGYLFNRKFKEHQTEEIIQETFIKIIKNSHLAKKESSFEAWCWRILRNTTNDYLRDIQKNREGINKVEIESSINEETMIYDTLQEQNKVQSETDCVSEGLQKFNSQDPDRGYALLLQMDGYKIEKIAMRIGRTPAATKEFLSQCKKKVAPFIKHCFEGS